MLQIITLSSFFGPLIDGNGVPFGGTALSTLLVRAPSLSSKGLKYYENLGS